MYRSVTALYLLVWATTAARAEFLPNDPDFSLCWHAQKTALPRAWDYSRGSTAVTIAIIDTGVMADTPDLAGRVLPPRGTPRLPPSDGSANHHGTWVASVAAGGVNNRIGGVGVGNFSILPITAVDADGFSSDDDVAAGIRLAASLGARVISVSTGALSYGRLNAAAADARAAGVLTFISAGNSNSRSTMTGYPNLIFVSGTDRNDQRWSQGTYGSTWGPFVDLSAPADDIYVADPTVDGGYLVRDGTSFSSPLAAGAAAMAWSINPRLSADQVQAILFNAAADLGDPGWDEVYGWGRIDVGAVAAAAAATVPEPGVGVVAVAFAGAMLLRRRAAREQAEGLIQPGA